MHEFSVAQNIIQRLKDALGEKMLNRIEKIHIDIGKLSGISVESLEFSLQVLLEKKGERILHINEIELEVRCSSCHRTYSPEDMIWICPYCKDMHAELIKGNEIKITDVEVRDED
ncbi:MAG: hydrogenase maturation nickel metallochaperone HypA [Deltaproteobacteria bacterium]|nr:hydrogenase maturation nickel metallochaperone HypA [Deltaproteobacteria bacterium]